MATYSVSFTCPRCDDEIDVTVHTQNADKATSTTPAVPAEYEIEESGCSSCNYTFSRADETAIMTTLREGK